MELSISASNFRRLREAEDIDVKPLTVLVGRNSSGKSTFLRLFPLLRQSVMTRTSSPLLWFGDLVDFGGYDIAVSDECAGEPIKLTFGIDTTSYQDDVEDIGFVEYESGVDARRELDLGKIKIEVFISPNKDSTYLSSVNLYIPKHDVSIALSASSSGLIEKINVNGENAISHIAGVQYKISTSSIFPTIGILVALDQETKATERFVSPIRRAHENALFKVMREYLDQRTKDQTIRSYAEHLLRCGLPGTLKHANSSRRISQHTIKPLIDDLVGARDTVESKNLYSILWMYFLPRVMRDITSTLESVMRSVLYIGPARARSDRYYRYQDLAVSEIDPDGKNFPMFLNSLTDTQMTSLSSWIEKLYDFGISVAKSGGHISIYQHIGGRKTNIVDTGYGVSQILPVLGQLWWAQNRRFQSAQRRSPNLSIIAIEQPELHLHPAHQALLADALVDLINLPNPKAPGRDNRFLIETHSEAFVNRLGELISKGKINQDCIQIILFETDDQDIRRTKLRKAVFDKKGSLLNWPFGFFLPVIR